MALFRYGLIADLRDVRPGDRSLHTRLEEKADARVRHPRHHASPRRRRDAARVALRLSPRRLRRAEASTAPRCRPGAGAPASAVADALCTLKEEAPTFSVVMLIATARQRGLIPAEIVVAPATVHRLLTRHGLMVRPPGTPTRKDRRRFAFALANDLWMSDVMHGPSVLDDEDRRRHKTYLIALLDDATRVVPHAAFARSETIIAFLPVFARAIQRRGVPARLYVDNGAAYRARHLALVCAKLGVTLIHARPYQPQAKSQASYCTPFCRCDAS